ncbi:aminoglycoside phosphotransferase family protein [Anthocerotibacter panamensis]|uniref:aminoglycoside phosphotransferase family protein n=1 Tax=Anthocerotibacter panamensis TaxID=2857077 RepID=UPI001C402A86|nr:aminoglycoside phosphotransferase family protein [Anthocerotibacter panamensis]
MLGTPSAEIEIDALLVSQLLAAQHPDLQNLSIQFMDAGWDNAMFRLGSHLAVRLPRRAVAARLLENEQHWLPQLAKQFSIAVPVPYRIGLPDSLYPWHWSVIPWLPGQTADEIQLNVEHAQQFGWFLKRLHVAAPSDAPKNPFRGVPLIQRVSMLHERMQRVKAQTALITPTLRVLWQQAVDAPIDGEPTWIHGDLHPRNILVDKSGVTGVIDWGDLTAGDRATDLAALWYLFPEQHVRQQALDAYGEVSEATLTRAKGWAILFGVILLSSGLVDHAQHATIGQKILQCIAQA